MKEAANALYTSFVAVRVCSAKTVLVRCYNPRSSQKEAIMNYTIAMYRHLLVAGRSDKKDLISAQSGLNRVANSRPLLSYLQPCSNNLVGLSNLSYQNALLLVGTAIDTSIDLWKISYE
jgi:hypothetical protein